MMRIHPLPSELANQIAAGEVIERPASVVKELLENALDAKAHHINIRIEAGGVRLIEVSDDGVGIHPDDLSLAVLSHATSKIQTLEDLFSIQSLGFRGEALASIASVSRFSLISKIAECSEGYLLQWEDRHPICNISPVAHAKGTTIQVRDLFFNTPVRRKFLSSEKTEWGHIENIVKRIALSHFDVGFQLQYKTVLNLPIATTDIAKESRVRKIFGTAFLEHAVKIDIENNGIRLWGWVGLPSLMRSQNDLQYVYLNGRTIRDKLIAHAIRVAYEGHLYPGRQPMLLLYLEMDPRQVDVNVHPTKHEVRFQEPRQVHDLINSQLTKVLTQYKHEKDKLFEISNKIAETSGNYCFAKDNKNVSVSANILSIDIQWLELPYCILKTADLVLLCNYKKLYQSICRQQLMQEIGQNQVITRPLLMPIRLTLAVALLDKIGPKIPSLEKFGLSLDRLDEQTLVVRHFPSILSHLDFKKWMISWQECIENKEESEEVFLNTLIEANEPLWPVPSHDLQATLNDFQRCLQNNDLSSDMKKSYRVMALSDWKKALES